MIPPFRVTTSLPFLAPFTPSIAPSFVAHGLWFIGLKLALKSDMFEL
jgi:hypothetical protein